MPAYQAYGENDVKLFVLLALVFLWRSINYWSEKREQMQTLTLLRLHMTHPSAVDDFFRSEHCYELTGRAYDILKRDRYFDEQERKKQESARRAVPSNKMDLPG